MLGIVGETNTWARQFVLKISILLNNIIQTHDHILFSSSPVYHNYNAIQSHF